MKPCGTRLGIRKGGKGAVRLPEILVLMEGCALQLAPARAARDGLGYRKGAGAPWQGQREDSDHAAADSRCAR